MAKIDEVRKVAEYLHDDCGYKYHIRPAVKNAVLLADKVGADKDVVEVAAYLHDIGNSTKLCGGIFHSENDHHIVGARECKSILKKIGYGDEFIEKVSACILTHRGRKGPAPENIEQKVLANADAMAHFDTFLDLFGFFLTKSTSSYEEAVTEIEKKMKRDWELKLTLPEAKEIARAKYEAIMLVLASTKEYF